MVRLEGLVLILIKSGFLLLIMCGPPITRVLPLPCFVFSLFRLADAMGRINTRGNAITRCDVIASFNVVDHPSGAECNVCGMQSKAVMLGPFTGVLLVVGCVWLFSALMDLYWLYVSWLSSMLVVLLLLMLRL